MSKDDIAVAATIFSAITLVPQVLQTVLNYNSREFAAVLSFNPFSMLAGIISNALWIAYAVGTPERVAVAVSSIVWLSLWLAFLLMWGLAYVERKMEEGSSSPPQSPGSARRR